MIRPQLATLHTTGALHGWRNFVYSGGVRSLTAIVLLLVTLATGLAGGVWLTSRMLDSLFLPGAMHYGPWSLWPRAGTADADPYTRALFARRGELALAPAEGLALYAQHDDAGRRLVGRCSYRIDGAIPAARVWSLAAYRPDGSLPQNAARRTALTSAESIGGTAGGDISISSQPSPGNWLPIGVADRFIVVLRLYDTPLTAISAALDGTRLPRIQRVDCQP